MPERLSPHDVSFLYAEDPTVPMHVGGLAIVDPGPTGLCLGYLAALVEDRLPVVPRYRQRLRKVPGGLARPVWVDDEDFDVDHHVRQVTLPKPGGRDQLEELVARIMQRRLDRGRSLWELYFIDGLADGRVGVLWKTHEAMVSGAGVDLLEVLLDTSPELPKSNGAKPWRPTAAPSDLDLLVGAVGELIRRPTAVLEAARLAALDIKGGALAAIARSAARPAPDGPLNVEVGERRRFAAMRTELDDYRDIRAVHGGTVTDAILATITGALRGWLAYRGQPPMPETVLRAVVPVGVRVGTDTSRSAAAGATRVASLLVDLPVGEPNPVVRLHQISYAMHAHRQTGHLVGARALRTLSGFAPPTLHALAAKAAVGFSRRAYNLMIANVPGPQSPLYLAGARVVETYPVVPLGPGQALAIGLTSYDGGVYYGLNADRDAMSDVGLLADLIAESRTELLESVR